MAIKPLLLMIFTAVLPLYGTELSREFIDGRNDLYIRSLEVQKKRVKLEHELNRQSEQETRVKRLALLARTASRNNLLKTAEKIYKKSAALYPSDPTVQREIAIVSAKLNHFSQAAVYFEKYHTENPGDMTSHFYHGEVLNWQRRFSEADHHYRMAEQFFLKLSAPSPAEQATSSSTSRGLGDFSRALQVSKTVHLENPDDPYLLIQYIDTLIAADQPSAAWPVYHRFLESYGGGNKETEILIKLIEPRLLHADLNSRKALTLTDHYMTHYPESAEAVSLKAAIMNNLSHWRKEKQAITKLKLLRPTDEDVTRRGDNLWWLHSSFLDAEAYFSSSDEGDTQFITRIHGEKRQSDRTAFGFISSFNFAKIPKSFDKDGQIKNRSGLEVVNELYVAFDFADADQLKLALHYLAADTVGLSMTHKLSLDHGSFKYHLEYRKPYWGITEGLLLGQVRDRVFMEKEWQFSNKLKFSIGSGLNRYGLEHAVKTGDTWSAQTLLTYRLDPRLWHRTLFGYAHGLFLNYSIDKEEVIDRYSRLSSSGTSYFPINHSDREVHTVNALLSKTVSDKHNFQTYIGYSYDRKTSDHGPSGGWIWRYRKTKNFEIRCFGSYALTTAFFTNIGVGVRWVF